MGPDNSPPQIVPLNSNNKKGPDRLFGEHQNVDLAVRPPHRTVKENGPTSYNFYHRREQ